MRSSPGNTALSDIRPAAVAGAFYPAGAAELEAQLDRFLAAAGQPGGDAAAVPKAVIAPHAGYVYSGPVASPRPGGGSSGWC
jgi:AmmeMemoRadiSam system protein B